MSNAVSAVKSTVQTAAAKIGIGEDPKKARRAAAARSAAAAAAAKSRALKIANTRKAAAKSSILSKLVRASKTATIASGKSAEAEKVVRGLAQAPLKEARRRAGIIERLKSRRSAASARSSTKRATLSGGDHRREKRQLG